MTITTYTDGRRVVKYDVPHESPRKTAQLPTIAEETVQQASECATQQVVESVTQKASTQPTTPPPDADECIEDKTTASGVRLRRYANGTEVVHFPDGSVETRTKELTVREGEVLKESKVMISADARVRKWRCEVSVQGRANGDQVH